MWKSMKLRYPNWVKTIHFSYSDQERLVSAHYLWTIFFPNMSTTIKYTDFAAQLFPTRSVTSSVNYTYAIYYTAQFFSFQEWKYQECNNIIIDFISCQCSNI